MDQTELQNLDPPLKVGQFSPFPKLPGMPGTGQAKSLKSTEETGSQLPMRNLSGQNSALDSDRVEIPPSEPDTSTDKGSQKKQQTEDQQSGDNITEITDNESLEDGDESSDDEHEDQDNESFWLPKIVKIVFGFILFAAITWGILATKLSLLIMIYPLRATMNKTAPCNLTRCFSNDKFCRLAESGTAADPQDLDCVRITAIAALSMVIMVPYACSFMWSLWKLNFKSEEPKPKWKRILWGIVMSSFEVAGICIFLFSVLSSPLLSQSFNILVMNAVHLVPLLCHMVLQLQLGGRKRTVYAVMFMLGILFCLTGLIPGYFFQSPKPSTYQALCLVIALSLLSLSWAPKRLPVPNKVGPVTGNSNDGERYSTNARWMVGAITSFFKLLVTFPIVYLTVGINGIVENPSILWPWNSQPLWLIHHNWLFFLTFLTNICSGVGVTLLAVVACKSKLQLPFASSTVASSVLFFAFVFVQPICQYLSSVIPGLNLCEATEESWKTALVVIGMCFTELMMVFCICQSSEHVMEPEAKLFRTFGFNAVFLNQHLLLNKKTKFNSPDEDQRKHRTSKNTHVYICTTMFHEDEKEMVELVKSIRRVATSSSEEDRRKYESHILFDDGCMGNDIQPYAIQLLSIIHRMTKAKEGSQDTKNHTSGLQTDETARSLLHDCTKWKTPYGLQLEFDWKPDPSRGNLSEGENRGMKFFIHLKDNQKVKNKKRWSQIMYMTYILKYAAHYRPLGMESGAIKPNMIKTPQGTSAPDALRLHGQTTWVGSHASPQVISIKLGEIFWVTGIILQASDYCDTRGRVIEIEVEGQKTRVDWSDITKSDTTVTCLLQLEPKDRERLEIKLLDWEGMKDVEPKAPRLRMEILGHPKDDPDRDMYILATDADVKFDPTSANSLLDLAQWNDEIGAVCGRTHCMGSGPVYWLQLFDYAVGHWFQKAANSTLGTVLCCPGCFSVYRCKAVRQCVGTYRTQTKEAKDFLMKDMGEDRWLCTLMIERGWRLVYTSIAEDRTYVPVSFKEFFNQRRRWGPSTVANQMEMIKKWWDNKIKNASVSFLFMLYQILLFLSFLIGPATAILIAAGGLDYYVSNQFPLEATVVIMSFFTFLFGYICLEYKQDTQLKWASALGSIFGIFMIMAMIALIEKIVVTIRDFMTSNGIGSSEGFGTQEIFSVIDTIYFIATIGMFLVTGLVHGSEFTCLFSGILYFFALPTTFIFLNIYGVCNLTDKSWGTREGASGKNDDSDKGLFENIGGTIRRMFGFSDGGRGDGKAKNDPESGNNTKPGEESKTGPNAEGNSAHDTKSKVDQKSILEKMAYLRRLETVDVKRDGSCFFHAVTDHPSVKLNSKTLRAEAVKHMRENKESFEGFNIESNFDEYLENMVKDGTFADHPVIQAAANVLKRTIHVIDPTNENDLTNVEPQPQPQNGQDPIFIGYLPDSQHYVSTRPLRGKDMMVSRGQPVRDWLAKVFDNQGDLKESYIKNFEDNGYDDTSYIAVMKQKELVDIGITDQLHRNTILKGISKLIPKHFYSRIPANAKDWLTSIGLEVYIDNFEQHGIKERSDLSQLKTIDLDELFVRIGIEKIAHIKRLKKSIKNMRKPTDVEELHLEVKEIINGTEEKDMERDSSPLKKKQYEMWEELRQRHLDPDKDSFSRDDNALKTELQELRDLAIRVLSGVNVFWLIVIIIFTKSQVLHISGQNPLGIISLFLFGVIQVIQFVVMLFHRAVAFLHWVARVDINTNGCRG